jgi:hypothetical protein
MSANLSVRVSQFLAIPVLLLACAFAALAQNVPNHAQVVLKGTVTYAQNKTFIDVPFDVPAGVHRLTLDIRYTDHEKQTVLDTGVFDPYRFRGNSGSNKSHFTIGETDATPSFLPGAIPAGKWHLNLGVSNIRPEVISSYEVDIFFDRPIDDQAFTDRALNGNQGWYRGDLHMHTAHSDGSCPNQSGQLVPCPVFVTAQAAAKRGLDFIAISDHNSISQADALRELQPYFDRLLFIPAREITTFAGHANLFGTIRFLDYRVGTADVPDVNVLARKARDLGGLLSISHPDAPGGEICRGCRWEPKPAVDMHLIPAVEVINGGDGEGFFPGLQFWETQLAQGYRPTAIGGSDNHRPDEPPQKPGSVGSPTTVVHATELSMPAILDGIRAGHVFIDLYGSTDRLLEMNASDSQGKAGMGDSLSAAADEDVKLSIHVEHCLSDRVQVLLDGQKPLALDQPILMGPDLTVTTTWKSDGKRHWVLAEVQDLTGALYLLGNPVYINY